MATGSTMVEIQVEGMTALAYLKVKVLENLEDLATPMVAVGKTHTVALKSDGTVWTWGDNTYGQLGRKSLEEIGLVRYPNSDPNSADFDAAVYVAA